MEVFLKALAERIIREEMTEEQVPEVYRDTVVVLLGGGEING